LAGGGSHGSSPELRAELKHDIELPLRVPAPTLVLGQQAVSVRRCALGAPDQNGEFLGDRHRWFLRRRPSMDLVAEADNAEGLGDIFAFDLLG